MMPIADLEINVSGTQFCSAGVEGPLCAQGIDQEFLGHAFFFEGDPPSGLALIDPDLMIRGGCEVEALRAEPAPRRCGPRLSVTALPDFPNGE